MDQETNNQPTNNQETNNQELPTQKTSVQNINNNIRSLPTKLMIPFVFSLICIILSVILSIYYVLLFIGKSIKQYTLSAPLNHQTLDYESVSSNSFEFNTSFNYTYFLILPGLSFLGILIFSLINIFTVDENYRLPQTIKKMISGMIISLIIVLALQTLLYLFSNRNIKNVKKRLDDCDNYICSRIYKNVKFLDFIDEPKESIISTSNSINNALSSLKEEISIEDYAKAFYTITLFNHYQKLSLTNPSIQQAFELFNPSVLLSYKGCKPSKYFNRYGSYIEDISETIIRPALPRTITKDAIKVSKAFELYNDWIVNTNNLANAIQPQQSLNSFIIVIISTVIIQIVYITVMYKMFKVNTDNDITAKVIQKIPDSII
jgi:hypothetical protein